MQAYAQTRRHENITFYGFYPDFHDEIILGRLMKDYAPKSKEQDISLREAICGNIDFIEDKILELVSSLPRGVNYHSCALVETIRACVTRKRARLNDAVRLKGIPERFTFVVGR